MTASTITALRFPRAAGIAVTAWLEPDRDQELCGRSLDAAEGAETITARETTVE